ncbi:MAG: 4Fe-4S ferredoxin [Acidobacteria bacterium]|jgi:hypothetical protein|nr:4Fe-4S ferredoxin [Acidobacteriota bacterium]|tara:strand:- start:13723 stop:14835 length:1113 start_codon:yes stop_codon:yes gene_type:complete
MGMSEQTGSPERVDERDTMFARMERRAGTFAYDDYYARRPAARAGDDRLRRMTPLLSPGGQHYDPRVAGEAAEYFRAIGDIEVDGGLVERWKARVRPSRNPTETIKALVRSLGAVAVGCAELDQAFIYTHKGRFDADYGRQVDLPHPSAIVFLVEMDFAAMQHAPCAQVIRESARQYYRAADIAKVLEAVLVACGYAARAHYDAHYDVILPPLAVKAGLGELGRNNILVADRFGSRVRIGAVTTDCPVDRDAPVSLGIGRFCEVCRKCADNCPSHALSDDAPVAVRGVGKWPTVPERCHGYWRQVGTDCGICMAVCPFSHPDTALHRLVRRTVRVAPWLSRPLARLDDLFYGRRWKARRGADASPQAVSS